MRKLLLLLCCVAMGHSLTAQEGIPVYQDYLMDNLYLLHPSMAGAANCGKVRGTARQQWFDQDDAPNLQTLSFNTAVGQNSGIGAILFNDQNGYHSQTGGYLSYAYHLNVGNGFENLSRVSFGVNVGLVQSRLDETSFDQSNFDPVIAGVLVSDSYFNIDVGASYLFNEFFIHATVKNAIFQNREIYSEGFESTNQLRFVASTGYLFAPRGSQWQFEPSVLYQRTDRTKEQFVDLNAKAFYDFNESTVLYMGASYRQSFEGAEFRDGTDIQEQNLSLLSPFIGAKFNNFTIGYTYSYQFGDVTFDSGGFHQITLGIDFLCRKDRWSCNCPAVNL
ncbi:PorP/SprF family type IX secretion system membrane protein [Nonlabens ponticola]|uniref:Type IX secretion system membrane protein PorP/SprF n=1 Tax=Nonlabens ponticola TaxID=2496866 RepID=A0A3S9MVW2_9FLAO|nr:type IX secretion system membrane protein PorP/SprF [Nonlabens ponticola]AZQ43320.1 type IX secretion system membrane protein PorP/SprF [Nonlabens ponticola]